MSVRTVFHTSSRTAIDIQVLINTINEEEKMRKTISWFFIAALVTIGCGTESDDSTSLDYELEITETRTWPAGNITQVNARTENGGITVSATQDTLITAEITRKCMGEDSAEAAEYIDNIEITEDVSGGQVTLEADMPDDDDDRNYTADFDINAPESIYVTLETVNGTILVSNMAVGADVRVTNGSITTENLRRRIAALTVNGEIDCDMASLPAGETAGLATTNGEVTLSLPVDVSATFVAQTANGTVTITGFPSVTYTVNEANHKAGTIGTGDAEIAIAVVNGDITIRAR